MAYQFVEFDGVSLPLLMASQNHQPMPIESSLVDSIGGVYDWRGSQRRAGRRQNLSLTGEFIGQTTYLVDEAGTYLVDDTGDYVIAGNGEQALHSKVSEIMAQIGKRGPLWRKRLADDALHWKTARMMAVPWPRQWEDHAIRATLTCQFETSMEFWHAEDATVTSVSTTSGVEAVFHAEVSAQTVNDAVLSVECTSGTITAVSVACDDLGIDIVWNVGFLVTGETLVIDCGEDAPPDGAIDSYDGFRLGVHHTARGWLPIPVGHWTFTITTTGGAADVDLTYYEQFA
jgi:hypothetical protein